MVGIATTDRTRDGVNNYLITGKAPSFDNGRDWMAMASWNGWIHGIGVNLGPDMVPPVLWTWVP